VLGFEVRQDVGGGKMRWLTLGRPGQDVSLVLEPPAIDPGLTDAEKQTILELMAKGSYLRLVLGTDDLDAVYAKVEASGAEVVQEITVQPYGVKDCAFRDPAGNLIRINQV
jgi:catechol 2,3-dioxygenase-like lactoylglutathione lyase family enzyme